MFRIVNNAIADREGISTHNFSVSFTFSLNFSKIIETLKLHNDDNDGGTLGGVPEKIGVVFPTLNKNYNWLTVWLLIKQIKIIRVFYSHSGNMLRTHMSPEASGTAFGRKQFVRESSMDILIILLLLLRIVLWRLTSISAFTLDLEK